MKKIAVYCGASPGRSSVFREAARDLGAHLAGAGITLVYGGGSVGLMGAVADTCLAGGGTVEGVITSYLAEMEVGHERLSRLHVVETMHERKALMAELADGFIALPGGLGTLDETFEVLTWSQLGLHDKPCGLLNIAGYYDSLLAFLDGMVGERFLLPEHRGLLLSATDHESLLEQMNQFMPVMVEKWVDRKIKADRL